jgi:hypothetical protein
MTPRPTQATPTWRYPTPFEVYVGVVMVTGTAVLAVAVVGRVPLVWRTADAIFVVIGVLLIASESRPIMLRRRGGLVEQVSLSGAFACALLLHYDWALVVAVHALGSLLDDQRAGLRWWKAGFNVGQYTLSLAGAALVLQLLGFAPAGEAEVSPPVLLGLLCCATFFVLNTILPGIAIAVQEGGKVFRTLRAGPARPVVRSTGSSSPWRRSSWPWPTTACGWSGLLVFPVVAVHRGAISALERDHMTLHDPLTGLPNQLAFRDSWSSSSSRPGTPTGTSRCWCSPRTTSTTSPTPSGPPRPTT